MLKSSSCMNEPFTPVLLPPKGPDPGGRGSSTVGAVVVTCSPSYCNPSIL
jgi:hypothetical protein